MSKIDLKDIFIPIPMTTEQLLGDPGVGFYVPIYQRGYNWDSKHIGRVFEDVGQGLQSLVKNRNSITFLGNLIVVDGSIPSDVNITEVGRVRIVIDGQQRLTTFLLINVCLHDEIRRRRSRLKTEDQSTVQWLCDEADRVRNRLEKTFAEEKPGETGIYRWFPRMIRGNNDSWSTSEEKARYKSPIAGFIHNYLKHIQGDNQTKKYTGYVNQTEKNSPLVSKYRVIQRKVESVWKGGDQNLEIPTLKEVAKSHGLQQAIFLKEFPEEVCSILPNGADENFRRLVRLILFANFLIERVAVTVLSVKDPDYALDMFESLNTTGEPLTAFETFKPKVVETEELDKYENSLSRQLMEPIEKYMDKFKDAQKRHTETSRLLIPFALAETGHKLSKRHSEQRRYLRSQYDKQNLLEEKHKFLEHMSHTAIFMEDTWKKEDKAFESMTFADDVALICMDLLGKVNHEIAIGSLVKFYSQVPRDTSDSQRAEAVLELERAIKAVTAFFTFWRGSGKAPGDLAAQYRELMGKGFEALGNQAFCRSPEEAEPLTNLTADKLQEALRYVLKDRGAIRSKYDWVTLSFEQPVYKDRKTLTRFLLFAALHRTTADVGKPGLRRSGREGTLDMFSWKMWNQEDLEIEHVVPQESESDLDIEYNMSQEPETNNHQGTLSGKPNLIDCLGNLTLLPRSENASFSNKPWPEKKELFYILSADTEDEQKIRLAEVKNRGVPIPERTENLIDAGKYWEHLSVICKAEKWDEEFVQCRSNRLADLIWTNIAPWLGIDGEKI